MLSIQSYVLRSVFSIEIIDVRSGQFTFRVIGDNASNIFKDEAGGHRWQRIPPTEKYDRVQTSTITVAVLPEPTELQIKIKDSELEWNACRGSGPGGQNRNKVNSAIQLKHLPSGIHVRVDSGRSQYQNRQTALATLRARIWEAQQGQIDSSRAQDRKQQLGSGMRGDKRRTIRVKDGTVVDHLSGRKWNLNEYMKGLWR